MNFLKRTAPRLLAWMLFMTSLTACSNTMTYYSKEQLDSIDVVGTTDGQHRLVFRPKLETLYFCPGATIEETATTQAVRLVRCSIHKTCKVDAKAEQQPDGSWHVTIPKVGNKEVQLVFN